MAINKNELYSSLWASCNASPVEADFQAQKKPPLGDFFAFRGAEGRTRTGTSFDG